MHVETYAEELPLKSPLVTPVGTIDSVWSVVVTVVGEHAAVSVTPGPRVKLVRRK